jgi:hypothetical protein
VKDVTSVNTVLQQYTGIVVRLNIQPEITYSTTVVEFNTPWRWCSDGISSVRVLRQQRDNLSRGAALILLKRASWSSGKLDSQTYNWRFEAN